MTAAAYPADIAFIIVVSSCGVSPAAQMRYGTAEQLRRNGYGEEDLRELAHAPGTWKDMDFDPEPIFASVSCPVLAFYGETDEWVPIQDSIAAWKRAGIASRNHDITVVELPGCDHIPTFDQQWSLEAISPGYTETMTAWLDERLRG